MIPKIIRQIEEAVRIASDSKISERLLRKLKNFGLDKHPILLDKGDIGSFANFVKMVKNADVPYMLVNDDGVELLICDHMLAKDIRSIAEVPENISFDRYHVYFISNILEDSPTITSIGKFNIKTTLEQMGYDFDDTVRHVYQFKHEEQKEKEES